MTAFWHFVTYHWFFAIPMFLMMLAAAVMLIWRILLNLNAGTNMSDFLPKFQDVLNREGVEGAIKFCKSQQGVIPRRLYVTGLENSRFGLAAMRRAMASVIELEIIPDLNFLLPPILAIAKIATMVGLLGTVISMIGTFQELGEAAKSLEEGARGGQAKASQEIGLALFATALGLMTAIPLVFAHVLCKAWVHKFEIKMKAAAQKLLVLIQARRAGAPAQPAQTGPAGRPGERTGARL
ncbi:MAG: hypothetical protein C4297_03215 [Gemmataceae bacterium]